MSKTTASLSNDSFFSVPVISRRPWAQISLFLNILPVPGGGNIVAGIKGKHMPTLIIGILLAVVDIASVALNYIDPEVEWTVYAIFLVWALSIIWGIRIFKASK